MKSLHTSLKTAHSGRKPSTFMSSSTHPFHVFLFLPYIAPFSPPHFFRPTPNHHHYYYYTVSFTLNVSAIIHTPTLHMPKPPQSTPPHHLIDALYTQKTVQIHIALSILQRHSTHPSHHHSLRPLQAMQILSLYRPCVSPICQHTLDTSSVS